MFYTPQSIPHVGKPCARSRTQTAILCSCSHDQAFPSPNFTWVRSRLTASCSKSSAVIRYLHDQTLRQEIYMVSVRLSLDVTIFVYLQFIWCAPFIPRTRSHSYNEFVPNQLPFIAFKLANLLIQNAMTISSSSSTQVTATAQNWDQSCLVATTAGSCTFCDH